MPRAPLTLLFPSASTGPVGRHSSTSTGPQVLLVPARLPPPPPPTLPQAPPAPKYSCRSEADQASWTGLASSTSTGPDVDLLQQVDEEVAPPHLGGR